MPQLGETVTEGTIARWLKQPGDSVEKYEAFVEVSTDKVNAEVPSPVTGTIRELIAAEGETVPTGAAIATIDEVAVEAPPEAPALPVSLAVAPVTVALAPVSSNGHSANGNGAATHNGTRVSPAVRRLAREHAVDPGAVHGTGTNGRVTAADIVAAASRAPVAVPAFAAAATVAATSSVRPTATAPRPAIAGELLPLTPTRRLIAQRMVESKHTAPHAWTMVEVDVSNLWAWRLAERGAFERDNGVKLTLLPFFMHAVAPIAARVSADERIVSR